MKMNGLANFSSLSPSSSLRFYFYDTCFDVENKTFSSCWTFFLFVVLITYHFISRISLFAQSVQAIV